eukprot:1145600-Pleurochrysis_carterae.AAC.1
MTVLALPVRRLQSALRCTHWPFYDPVHGPAQGTVFITSTGLAAYRMLARRCSSLAPWERDFIAAIECIRHFWTERRWDDITAPPPRVNSSKKLPYMPPGLKPPKPPTPIPEVSSGPATSGGATGVPQGEAAVVERLRLYFGTVHLATIRVRRSSSDLRDRAGVLARGVATFSRGSGWTGSGYAESETKGYITETVPCVARETKSESGKRAIGGAIGGVRAESRGRKVERAAGEEDIWHYGRDGEQKSQQ